MFLCSEHLRLLLGFPDSVSCLCIRQRRHLPSLHSPSRHRSHPPAGSARVLEVLISPLPPRGGGLHSAHSAELGLAQSGGVCQPGAVPRWAARLWPARAPGLTSRRPSSGSASEELSAGRTSSPSACWGGVGAAPAVTLSCGAGAWPGPRFLTEDLSVCRC